MGVRITYEMYTPVQIHDNYMPNIGLKKILGGVGLRTRTIKDNGIYTNQRITIEFRDQLCKLQIHTYVI